MRLVIIGGLGNMLGPASQHLQGKKEVSVVRVLDRGTPGSFRDQCRDSWRKQQTQLVATLPALIADGDFDGVLICAGKNGDDYGLIKELVLELSKFKKSYFICHLSTVSCEFAKSTYAFCQQSGIEYANYPLTGGSIGALNASMLILASGPAVIYHKLEPILQYLGRPRYFGTEVDAGTQVKLLGHTLVFYGLLGISSAVNLDARYHGYKTFHSGQAEVFDFLSQGAGGTKQWDVAMKHGIANNNWQQGFLLKHAVVDLIYLIQLMLQQGQPGFSVYPLLTLAFSFAYIAHQEVPEVATQLVAQYWLPDRIQALNDFVAIHMDQGLSAEKLLLKCVDLLPKNIHNSVMLNVSY